MYSHLNILNDLLWAAEEEDDNILWRNDPDADGCDGPRIVYGAKGSLVPPPQKRKNSITLLGSSLETPKKTKYHQ